MRPSRSELNLPIAAAPRCEPRTPCRASAYRLAVPSPHQRFDICGSPIGGENPPHDRVWRAAVAQAALGRSISTGVWLDFRLEPPREVDLDNLVRPALAGLRDAGVCTRGFRDLQTLIATKRATGAAGLTVTLEAGERFGALAAPGQPLVDVECSRLPIAVDERRMWQRAVAESWGAQPPVVRTAFVDIEVASTRSLEGLLKPVIDGLTPCLGRDPRGHLEFVPNDHLITWLRIRRATGPPLSSDAPLL